MFLLVLLPMMMCHREVEGEAREEALSASSMSSCPARTTCTAAALYSSDDTIDLGDNYLVSGNVVELPREDGKSLPVSLISQNHQMSQMTALAHL
jgi:positive regulator of sigma E activity